MITDWLQLTCFPHHWTLSQQSELYCNYYSMKDVNLLFRKCQLHYNFDDDILCEIWF